MRAYDEYENLDEYEEDSEELEEEEAGEEQYEEEEVHQPTQDELEYLGLRARLKEAIRKKMKKESGSANASSLSKRNLSTKDNFGSFFGPSQPVIAQRVIQESKSLLENPDLATKVFKSNNTKSKSSASTPVGSKPRANGSAPKVTNGVKTKVQMLKNTRDYSFLLSDDAELPAPAKDRTPQNASARNSDARSAKMQQRSREPPSNGGRKVPDGHEERKLKPLGNQVQGKMGTQKMAAVGKPKQPPLDSKRELPSNKQLPSNKGIGPGRPSVEKAGPSKIPVGTLQKKVSAPGAGTLQKKVSAPGAKPAMPHVHKSVPTKLQPSVSKQPPSVSKQPLVQKRESQDTYKSKVLQKPPVSSSKSQIKQPLPRNSSRMEDQRANRKPIRREEPRRRDEDDDDGEAAISMIRQMFGYNPNKYRDDDDDRNMEVGFDQIQREERHSAKVGKEEDLIALREEEEEERRKQMRKEAKKRKLSQR